MLGSLRTINLPLREGVGVYLAILVAAVVGSQMYEAIATRQNNPPVPGL
jgi:hypothetical protein